MTVRLLRRAALAALALLPLLVRAAAASGLDAGTAPEFETLLQTGFKDVRENAARAERPAPPAKELDRAPDAAGGVFLHSSLDGRLAYCSASGCRLLLDAGAGVVVLAGPGALYFTGTIGTGYCTARRCSLYLPDVRVTFPLTAGPKGDIYGSDDKAGYHCAPDACRKASSAPLQRYTNYIQGVYKPQGDFVSSSADGTFWCKDGACARIGDGEMLFIDGNCAGTGPADAAYGFEGSYIFRCTTGGCRDIGLDHNVDNFVECAFDERGRLLLPARDDEGRRAKGAILCSERGVAPTTREISSIRAAKAPVEPARSSEFFIAGDDGATYSLASHAADGAPGAGKPRRLSAAISRSDASGRAVLKFDAPVACWQWTDGDGDEDAPMWNNDCRVIR